MSPGWNTSSDSIPDRDCRANYSVFRGRAVRDGEDWYLVYGVQDTLGRPSEVELVIWRGPLPTG